MSLRRGLEDLRVGHEKIQQSPVSCEEAKLVGIHEVNRKLINLLQKLIAAAQT
jgi:hypothetical protein